MKRSRLARVLKLLPFAVLFFVAFGFGVMALWNWLMPALFGLKTIGYWQALGLFVLAKVLFGGIRGGSSGSWRHRILERCEQMTPEEREKFREAFYRRWGGAAPPESKPQA
jgi:hypothetical protein